MRRLALAAALILLTSVQAFALTTAQLATLRTDINANATVVPAGVADCPSNFVGVAINALPNTQDANLCIARVYNLDASPAFWVWRTSVSKDEYLGSTSVDATTFSFVGTGYITRAQGERDAWNALFDSSGNANPSRANVRQAIADIFSGATAPAPANRTHLLTVSRRLASRGEKLYATGTGSTASPGLLVVLGPLTGADVDAARAN